MARPISTSLSSSATRTVRTVTQDFQLGTLDACIQLQDAQLPQLASTPGVDAQAIRVNGYD